MTFPENIEDFVHYSTVTRGEDELMLTSLEYIEVAGSTGVQRLPAHCLRQAGFDEDQALLGDPAHAHPAYALLQQYFAFPRTFQFFDITGLRGRLGSGSSWVRGPGLSETGLLRSMLSMRGIEERVRDLNGSMTIEAMKGKGTRLAIRLPLPQGEAEVPLPRAAGQ